MKGKLSTIFKISCFLLSLSLFVTVNTLSYGNDISLNYKNKFYSINNNFTDYPELVNFDETNNLKSNKYRESNFRRFEIVFFISLPISFILTLGGTLLYKQISGNKGNFNGIEYEYMVMSTIGISFSVALRDYFIINKSIAR